MQQVINDIKVVNDVVKLAIKEHPQYDISDKVQLFEQVDLHAQYGTLDWVYKEGEMIAVVRYNIINNGRVADVLDLIIKKGNNSRKVIKYLIAGAWLKFPSLIYLRFERFFKDNKGYRMYRMDRFFKERNTDGK
jgi:hypothetical protein